MIKYVAVSTAAKAFSLNRATKVAYRRLGNAVLERSRVKSGLADEYVGRARRLVELVDEHATLTEGSRALEVGTGWLHWEATVLRLFFPVRVTLYDVSDNRLFGAYQSWLGQLDAQLESIFDDLDPDRVARARATAASALEATDFDDLYERLGFEYVVEESGSLDAIAGTAFDLVVSADVLEHVHTDTMATFLRNMYASLTETGRSIHQIDLVDHFHYFDRSTPAKNYYRYGDTAWRRLFESDVQYFNRVQRPEWLAAFAEAGFELVEAHENLGDPYEGKLADPFRSLSDDDQRCMQFTVVHKRSAAD